MSCFPRQSISRPVYAVRPADQLFGNVAGEVHHPVGEGCAAERVRGAEPHDLPVSGVAPTSVGTSAPQPPCSKRPRDLDATEQRQFLRIIVDQADNIRGLIDDLLSVTHIETGTLPVSPEPTEVARLLDRARNTFLSGGGRNNLDINWSRNCP